MTSLLSIVIANYNYGRFIEEAIRSIIDQGMGGKVELIICDAASTDNSVDIIKRYANGLPPNTPRSEWQHSSPQTFQCANYQHLEHSNLITWWCSEPDGGQSAAFNKGFSHAHGRFLTWLNADDIMMPGTLERFERAVRVNPDCEWFVGGVMWLTKEMKIIKCGRGRPFSRLRATSGELSVWGPSSFFSQALYKRVGGIDERFRYTMDTDLWCRFYRHCGARYLPFINYAWGLRLHECAKMSAHNFAESGEANPDHPKWTQIAKENEWTREKCGLSGRFSLVKRILSISPIEVGLAKFDTFRFGGRHYREFYEGRAAMSNSYGE